MRINWKGVGVCFFWTSIALNFSFFDVYANKIVSSCAEFLPLPAPALVPLWCLLPQQTNVYNSSVKLETGFIFGEE